MIERAIAEIERAVHVLGRSSHARPFTLFNSA
jgi:hypothetical protein